ncbi:DUF3800 domain-containing protein [Luteolibacter flavescens]|uniref:DUF3800 domain-containing protein n=1 Tax=Luteolibacter flavescens TaxID=1859460 RepID=A0ABT3FK52_9BACT|nr:DUF3800 domain-containing protein [Luteolibacter flavescens]MCW1883822.1 DUF3800 domain-containing protein [Luteolibacter flavescens]
MKREEPSPKHYFVDEAGDPVLFSGKGKVLIGSEGCSRYFAVGMLDVKDPKSLAADFDTLRAELLADPYFKNVPSMQARAKKTALFFHAKNDLPEVRREVFKCIMKHHVRFSAVVRDKVAVLDYVRSRNENDVSYRFRPDETYDHAVRRLFRDRLHKHDDYSICFAVRGNSDRTNAFREALEAARTNSAARRGVARSDARLQVRASYPNKEPALQAVDYFLWALQRTYERGEDRYLQMLWPQCSLVVDADDIRIAAYGSYYTSKNPLLLEKLKGG